MKKLYSERVVRFWWVWPIAAMILVYVLIMVLAAGQSVWFDEGYSILISKRPIPELLALTGVDAHPPLYYLLLKAWGTLFSWNEYALRSFSALCTSLAVGGIFLLVRKLFTVRAAIVALPFLIVAPFMLRFGYEIRMYALALLIGVIATLVLVHARQRQQRKWWIAYAILVALGMYTLYMLAALWCAHAIWLLVVTIKEKKNFLKQPWFYAYVVAVVLFLPYISTLLYQLGHSALPGIGSELTLTKLGGAFSTLVTYQPDWAVNGTVSALLLAVVGLTIYIHVGMRKTITDRDRKSLLLIYVLAFVPMFFFMVTSINNPIYINRYMAHVCVYLYLLFGVTIALGYRYSLKIRTTILTVIVGGLLLFGLVNLYQSGNYVFERLQKPSTAALRPAVNCSNSVVVTNDPYTYIDSIYYFDGCDVRFIADSPVQKLGGYGLLFDSADRIANFSEIDAPTIYYLHWIDAEQIAAVDSRYELVRSDTYDKQVVDTYRSIEE